MPRTRIDEVVARDAIRAVEDMSNIERLHPCGRRTADWRVTMIDGRVADVEVTMNTAPEARSFWHQIHNKPGPEWPDPRLSHVWTVIVSDHDPEANKHRPAKQVVDALIPVLVATENTGATPEQMVLLANERLCTVKEYIRDTNWAYEWQKAAAATPDIDFKEWVPIWALKSGYWNPQLLADHFDDSFTARHVRVVKPPVPTKTGNGLVYTYPMVSDGGTWGDYEALLSAVQESIDKKTERDQLRTAPSLKWLAVMLDGGHAGWQLNDHFGPDAEPPYPFEVFGDVAFDYFDEVWVIAPSAHETYTVIRLADLPTRHIIHSAAR